MRIEDQVDKALGFDHNRKVLIKQIVFDIQMQLEYLDITGQEGNLKTLLDAKRLAGTFAYPTGDDVKTWVDNFLLPFKETLIQNHLSRTEPFKSWEISANKALNSYNECIKNNEQIAIDINNYLLELKKIPNVLRSNSDTLTKMV